MPTKKYSLRIKVHREIKDGIVEIKTRGINREYDTKKALDKAKKREYERLKKYEKKYKVSYTISSARNEKVKSKRGYKVKKIFHKPIIKGQLDSLKNLIPWNIEEREIDKVIIDRAPTDKKYWSVVTQIENKIRLNIDYFQYELADNCFNNEMEKYTKVPPSRKVVILLIEHFNGEHIFKRRYSNR